MEENCIVTGFWVEGFGEVEIRYFADKNVLPLNDINKTYIEIKTTQAIKRLFKEIQEMEE